MSLHSENTPLQHDLFVCVHQLLLIWKVLSLTPSQRSVEQSLSNSTLNNLDTVVECLDDGLSLQRLDGKRVCLSWHDNKGNNGHLRAGGLEAVVKAGQGFNEHVTALVPVFITTGGEEVEGVFEIKVVVSVKVTSNEIVNLFFRLGVKVLELVHSGELDNVQPVW